MKTLFRKEDVAEIRRRMSALTEDDTRLWGVMTVGEMAVHVRESYWAQLREDRLAPVAMPLPRAIIKFFALRMPLRWPKTLKTVPELNREALPTPESFAVERTRMLEALEEFVACSSNRRRHPMFGAMDPADWMRWGYLHPDHHLRQFGR